MKFAKTLLAGFGLAAVSALLAPAAAVAAPCVYAASEGLNLTPPECAIALANAPIVFQNVATTGGDVYNVTLNNLFAPGGTNSVFLNVTLDDLTQGTSSVAVVSANSSVSLANISAIALNTLITFDVSGLTLSGGDFPPGIALELDCQVKVTCDKSYGMAFIADNGDGTYNLSTIFALNFDLTGDNGLTFVEQAIGPSIAESINIAPPNLAVPEPLTLSLVGGGLVAFGAMRRRKASKA